MKLTPNSFRKKFLTILLIVLAASVVKKLPISLCSINIGWFKIIYPGAFIETLILNHRINPELIPGMGIMVFALLLAGRFYCSWICTVVNFKRQFLTLFESFRPKQFKKIDKKLTKLRARLSGRCGFGPLDSLCILVGLLLGIAIFDFPIITIFSPMSILSRNLIDLFSHFRLRFDLLLLSIPILIDLLFSNGWKMVCPSGVLRNLVSRFNTTIIPVINKDLCNGCRKCTLACPVSNSKASAKLDFSQCIKCYQCIDACSQDAIKISFFDKKQ